MNGASRLVLTLGALVACACAGRQAPPAEAGQSPLLGEQNEANAPRSQAPPDGASRAREMLPRAKQAYAEGMQAFKKGELRLAKSAFQKAVELDPGAAEAAYALGTVRQRLGETSGALGAYRRALSLAPDHEGAIVAYALLTGKSGRLSEAEALLRAKQAELPQSAAVTAALAEIKSLDEDSVSAQRLAQEALKKDPDYRPAMVILARDHYRNRRLDLALFTLKGILDGYGPENPARDPRNAEALLLRGLIYREQNQRGAAIDSLRKALLVRPDLVEARMYLSAYLLEAGNAAEAAALLEGAARYDDRNVLVRLHLGDAYRLLGRPGDALQQLSWVAQKEPKMPQVHYNLGLLYLFSSEIPGVTPKQAVTLAVEHLERYQSLKPRSGPDDVNELITRAKTKKALLEAKEAEQAATPAAPGGSGSSAGQVEQSESEGSGG